MTKRETPPQPPGNVTHIKDADGRIFAIATALFIIASIIAAFKFFA